MKTLAIVVLLAVAGMIGYWFGGQQHGTAKVGAGETASADAAAAPGGKKLLYYRNPMGLPDTSPTPKKDSMGMDYIAVYEGEEDTGSGEVKISTARVQKLGVRVEAAHYRELSRPLRAAGRVEIDERRVHTVAPKFEGWIESLQVSATGQPVGRGQPLFEAYSPELVAAQREYQVAAQGLLALKDASPEAKEAMRRLAEAALVRLSNWDISAAQIERLAQGGEARRTLSFRAPAGGVVLEKKAVAGMRFMPGEMLYQIADLGSVWVLADVFERDIGALQVGQSVQVTINAYPDKVFTGKLAYIYPTLNVATRTVPIRVELANPGGLLKPAMYANVEIMVGAGGTAPGKVGAGGTAPAKVGAGGTALVVPISAVIDSGTRQTVLVQKEEGRFEPRAVKLGLRGDDYVEVKEGVKAGEQVVVAANFLIDSESNLKAALGGMQEKPAVSHHAVGILDSIEPDGSVMVTHEPVPSLKWPKMTMEFVPANAALVAKLKPGAAIHFEFVERKPGEWVITKLEAH
ncbi:MAG: efflux RND transporter periplasmic adaptor subunit [Rhodocyclaceae bacterium]|nr:efflux RND transporter periplasmic adaptor subunit [Rhodocyclaceae bacterium]